MGAIFTPRYCHGFLLSGNKLHNLIGKWATDADSISPYSDLWPGGRFVPGRIYAVKIHAIGSYDKLGIFIETTGSSVDLIHDEDWIETEMAG